MVKARFVRRNFAFNPPLPSSQNGCFGNSLASLGKVFDFKQKFMPALKTNAQQVLNAPAQMRHDKTVNLNHARQPHQTGWPAIISSKTYQDSKQQQMNLNRVKNKQQDDLPTCNA